MAGGILIGQEQSAKVLFVDDERNILKSIQRELLTADFEVFTAQGAREGLEILEREKIDIVVSDYRMPDMDGFDFLKIVKEQYPGAYRVILSGFVEQSIIFRALSSGLAAVYIPKPWEPQVLLERLAHILHTKASLQKPEVLSVIRSIDKLPALPGIYQKFTRAVEEERSNEELASIIKQDVALATKVLQVANSAFYGSAKHLSVEWATIYIGVNALREIVLVAALANQIKLSNKQQELLSGISIHSNLVNYGIHQIYRLLHKKPVSEQYASLGITHDIGKVIQLCYFPERYYGISAYMEENPETSFHDSEAALKHSETDHTVIGAYFLDFWNLPESSIEIALYHHEPDKGNSHYRDILEACQLADRMVEFLFMQPESDLRDVLVGINADPDNRDLIEVALNIKAALNESLSNRPT
jgi:HD-like signal output (HDOD) protein/CheY-like chemotaxis protein